VVCGVSARCRVGCGVTVWPIDGVVHEVTVANNITQGQGVQSAASGQDDPATTSLATQAAVGTLLGTALPTATA
jgi:hypothetical protein